MKKYLFILLLTIAGYGQTLQNPTFGNTTTNKIKVKTNSVSTTALNVGVLESDGSLNKMTPTNLPIPQTPVNYTPATATIGGHLAGIDSKIGTKAEDSNVIHKTGDETKTGVLTLSDQLILGEVSGSPQELWKLPANSLLKYNNLQTNQYGFNITTAGADNFFWVNDEGLSRQCMLYADGDSSGTDSDIFGLSASQDSGVSYVKNFSVTQGGDVYIRKLLNINNSTASTIASFDSSKNLVSLPTATYPSLTELSYVKGVTSSLQTQLNTKTSGSASNGQVTFWNGTSSQTGDSNLIWDNTNKRLGIGINTPLNTISIVSSDPSPVKFHRNSLNNTTIEVSNTSGSVFFGKPTNGLFAVGSSTDLEATRKIYVHTSGGVSIGNLTDLGNATLNVTGNISTIAATTANQVPIKSQLDLKADLASPALTGDPKAPTPTAGDNDTSIATTAFVTSAIATATGNYKKYVALLNQTGTSAPVATVLENTLGGTVVWSYTSAGIFNGTCSIGAFTVNKTIGFIGSNVNFTTNNQQIGLMRSTDMNISLQTYISGVQTNGVLNYCVVEIRVYN